MSGWANASDSHQQNDSDQLVTVINSQLLVMAIGGTIAITSDSHQVISETTAIS